MTIRQRKRPQVNSAAVLLSALVLTAPLLAGGPDASSWNDAAGSWFGRAVAQNTICPPGAPGCPVPAEIVMMFTINKDGTLIVTHSNSFGGDSDKTAHGEWERSGSSAIRGAYTLLQSSPSGIFVGGFKNLVDATVVNHDELRGRLDMFLYNYTNASGMVIQDADGFPTPSPLAPPSECATTAGCTHLGDFSFLVRRVETQ